MASCCQSYRSAKKTSSFHFVPVGAVSGCLAFGRQVLIIADQILHATFFVKDDNILQKIYYAFVYWGKYVILSNLLNK